MADTLDAIAKEVEEAKPVDLKQEIKSDETVKSRSADGWKLDGNSDNGDVVEYLHEDEGKFHVEQLQDVEPVLEYSKARHNEGFHGSSEWKHAGSFPPVIVHAWLNMRGLDMRDFKGPIVNEFLNDKNHEHFRIWKGRV